MLQSKLFKSFLITLIGVSLLEVVAMKLYLFSTIFWFDMVMHFAGGFFISMFVLWCMTWFQNEDYSYMTLLLYGLVGTVVVGICWELYELYFGITFIDSADYWSDTGMDIVMDTFGGMVAVLYSYNKLRQNNTRVKSGTISSFKI